MYARTTMMVLALIGVVACSESNPTDVEVESGADTQIDSGPGIDGFSTESDPETDPDRDTDSETETEATQETDASDSESEWQTDLDTGTETEATDTGSATQDTETEWTEDDTGSDMDTGSIWDTDTYVETDTGTDHLVDTDTYPEIDTETTETDTETESVIDTDTGPMLCQYLCALINIGIEPMCENLGSGWITHEGYCTDAWNSKCCEYNPDWQSDTDTGTDTDPVVYDCPYDCALTYDANGCNVNTPDGSFRGVIHDEYSCDGVCCELPLVEDRCVHECGDQVVDVCHVDINGETYIGDLWDAKVTSLECMETEVCCEAPEPCPYECRDSCSETLNGDTFDGTIRNEYECPLGGDQICCDPPKVPDSCALSYGLLCIDFSDYSYGCEETTRKHWAMFDSDCPVGYQCCGVEGSHP